MAQPKILKRPRVRVGGKQPSDLLMIGPIALDTVHIGDITYAGILGGSVSFAAIAAGFFAPTVVISQVGTDDFTKSHLDRFINAGVDVSHIHQKPGKSFSWEARYYEDFNKRDTVCLSLGAFEGFTPTLSTKHAQTPYVFIGSIDPELQLAAIHQLEGKPFIAGDVIDFWIQNKKKELLAVLEHLDLLVLNDAEACALSGKESILHAGYALQRGRGIESVIIKKGEHGCLFFHKEGLFAFPSYPVLEIKDPTGAGDTFAGALMGYIAASGQTNFENIKRGIVYATSVASISIEAVSTIALEAASADLVQERYEMLRAITRIESPE